MTSGRPDDKVTHASGWGSKAVCMCRGGHSFIKKYSLALGQVKTPVALAWLAFCKLGLDLPCLPPSSNLFLKSPGKIKMWLYGESLSVENVSQLSFLFTSYFIYHAFVQCNLDLNHEIISMLEQPSTLLIWRCKCYPTLSHESPADSYKSVTPLLLFEIFACTDWLRV